MLLPAAAVGHEQPLVGAWLAAASCPKRVSNVLSSNSTNSAWTAGELPSGLMNPQHLKLLSDWSDLYRHLITLEFTQHDPAQRDLAADDLDLRPAASDPGELTLSSPFASQTDAYAVVQVWSGRTLCKVECQAGAHSQRMARSHCRIQARSGV